MANSIEQSSHLLIRSRGMVFEETKMSLARLCKPKHTDLLNLVILLIKEVVEASYRCWIARNQIERKNHNKRNSVLFSTY